MDTRDIYFALENDPAKQSALREIDRTRALEIHTAISAITSALIGTSYEKTPQELSDFLIGGVDKIPESIGVDKMSDTIGAHNDVSARLNMSIDELQLGTRARNTVLGFFDNIVYIGDLCQKTEMDLLRTGNCGKVTLAEFKSKLSEKGLSLGMKNISKGEDGKYSMTT